MTELYVLVVDDEQAIRQVLAAQLTKAGHRVDHVGDGSTALQYLSRNDYDICICDIRLPGLNGIEVIRESRKLGIETNFLMITAFASLTTAIEAMKEGAHDYLMKPVRFEDLLHRLDRIADITRLRLQNTYLRNVIEGEEPKFGVESVSPVMRQVKDLVAKVSGTESTVLITGESGTGKSFIARAIHKNSARAENSFVSVNCGAIPENLLESELFGHLKGSFTGADRNKKGLFREADGGTIFLDEIFEMPLSLQVKLLHVLEEKEIRPLGAEQPRRVDARILAATNRDIEKALAEGNFRSDLFYRLNVLHIHLPPLRERREDIPALLSHFLNIEARRLEMRRQFTLDATAEEVLVNYAWPGNIRELQNVIARTMVLVEGDTIHLSDLPPQVLQAPPSKDRPTGPVNDAPSGTLRERVRQFEISIINEAIFAAGGDRQTAARSLGIGLSTLYRKLEEMGK